MLHPVEQTHRPSPLKLPGLTWLVFLPLLLLACEKKIDIKIKDNNPKLVVEATIENDQPPQVILTRSAGYFSSLTAASLLQGFVHGAQVYVSNGSRTHQLKEYTVPIGLGQNLYYYGID